MKKSQPAKTSKPLGGAVSSGSRLDPLRPRRCSPLYSKRFLTSYGRGLIEDEIKLVQAYRGLPADRQNHLMAYASGLVLEHASDGRVSLAATAQIAANAEIEIDAARRWTRIMGRAARRHRDDRRRPSEAEESLVMGVGGVR